MNRPPQCSEFAPLMLPSETGQGMTRLACIRESHSDDEFHESAEHTFMGYTVKMKWKSPKNQAEAARVLRLSELAHLHGLHREDEMEIAQEPGGSGTGTAA